MTEVSPPPPAETAEEIEGGFSRRAVAWIVGSVAASFVAAVLLGVYGGDLERRPELRANTFSHGALGHHALTELLRRTGLGVVSRRSSAGGGVGPHRPLILAEPDLAAMRAGRLEALRKEAKERGALLVVVLPKWRPGAPHKDHPEWPASVEFIPAAKVRRVVRALDEPDFSQVVPRRFQAAQGCAAPWGEARAKIELKVEIEAVQLLEPRDGFETVVGCAGGDLVALRQGTELGPTTVLIADPDLLNNHGLDEGDNAAVVHRLLTQALGASGVVFDETVHGFHRTPGLLAEALRFPMSLGVFQSLLLLGIILWAGMGRFGKPLPVSAGLAGLAGLTAGKEVLIDNTAKLLAAGGHAGDSLARYFRQTIRAVAAHYFLPPDLPENERLAKLQRLGDHRGDGGRGGTLSLADLEQSVRRFSDSSRGAEPAAKIAQRLHQWRVEMTHVNRESP